MAKDVRVGFSLLRGGGGPTIFLNRLRERISAQCLGKTTYFFDPRADINIYSNLVRNPLAKPYIFRVDGIYFDKAQSVEENLVRNLPIFNGIRKSAGVVFQSEYSEKLVTELYGRVSQPSVVIHNGVDLKLFSDIGPSMRGLLGIADSDVVFISSAKWRAHKRLDAVIEAFSRYRENQDNQCHLLIMGDAGDYADRLKHSGVQFVGHVDPADLPRWYRTADYCLFFSWLDPCPNTVVETLACGVPVICTNQGGTRELIERSNGGTVAIADDEFDFRPTYLYRPPKPDYDAIMAAIALEMSAVERGERQIERTAVDINNTAIQYMNFINSVLGT